MNKTAAVAVAAVVGVCGAAAGAFAWTGGQVVAQLQEGTGALRQFAPTVQVVDEKLERGLFRSHHELTVRLGCVPALPSVPGAPPLPGAGEPIEIGLRSEVRHGPLLAQGTGFASIDTVVLVPEKWRARVDALTNKQPPLRMTSVIKFDRSFTGDFTVPAIHFKDDKAGTFDVDAIRGHVAGPGYDAQRGGTYKLDMPGFHMNSRTPDATLSVAVGRMESETKIGPRPDPTLWFGPSEGKGTLAEVSIEASAHGGPGPATPVKMVFSALQFSQQATLDKGLYASTMSYSGRASFNDVKVDKLELKGGARRLHAATYQKLIKQIFELALSCDPKLREQGLEAQFPVFERSAVELLTHDPEYGLDTLAVELAGKRGELSYSIGTKGVQPQDAQRAMLDLAMQYGVINAHARVQLGLLDAFDKQLAASNPGMPPDAPGPLRSGAEFLLGQFQESGYVVQTDDAIESTLSYQGGQLLLNGKPPVLPDMGALLGKP